MGPVQAFSVGYRLQTLARSEDQKNQPNFLLKGIEIADGYSRKLTSSFKPGVHYCVGRVREVSEERLVHDVTAVGHGTQYNKKPGQSGYNIGTTIHHVSTSEKLKKTSI